MIRGLESKPPLWIVVGCEYNLWDQTFHYILDPLTQSSGQRPRTRLAQDVQRPTFFYHIKVCALSLAIEANTGSGFTHMQVANGNFGKPIWELGIEQ